MSWMSYWIFTHKGDFEPDPSNKTAGLLVKKWTGLIRLQRKVGMIQKSSLLHFALVN